MMLLAMQRGNPLSISQKPGPAVWVSLQRPPHLEKDSSQTETIRNSREPRMANTRLSITKTRFSLPRSVAREVKSSTSKANKYEPIARWLSDKSSRKFSLVTVFTSILQNESAEYDGGFGGKVSVTKRHGKKKPAMTSAVPSPPIKPARRREDKRGIPHSFTTVFSGSTVVILPIPCLSIARAEHHLDLAHVLLRVVLWRQCYLRCNSKRLSYLIRFEQGAIGELMCLHGAIRNAVIHGVSLDHKIPWGGTYVDRPALRSVSSVHGKDAVI